MAIEIFPDSPIVGMSPRISFSHDLPQTDVVPVEQYIRTTTTSSIDFDFCVFRETLDQQDRYSSSADELFFDGKILPIEIKKRLAPPPPTRLEPPPPRPPLPPGRLITNETSKNPINSETSEQEKQKSFWRFKRSSSLNCGSGYGRTLCPLPLLSRSNSTGSTGSGKRSSFLKSTSSNSTTSQKQARPPLKKNNHFSYSNGIKFSPVLNVPPANLFGLGSIFSGSKSKRKY